MGKLIKVELYTNDCGSKDVEVSFGGTVGGDGE